MCTAGSFRSAGNGGHSAGERCKLLDLGNWIDERYRVPSEPTTTGDHDSIGSDQDN